MQDLGIFNALIESSIFGAMIIDTQSGEIVFSNRRAEEILGYKKGELLGLNEYDFVFDDSQKDRIRGIDSRRSKGEVFKEEYTSLALKTKSGSKELVDLFAYTIKYKHKPASFIVLIDKTKEKTFEKLFFALSQVNQLVVQVDDEEELIKSICDILVDVVGYRAATIGFIDKDSMLFKAKYIKSKSKTLETAIADMVAGVDSSKPYGRGVVSRTYNSGKLTILNDVLKNIDMSYWRQEQIKFNIHSICSIPIYKNKKMEYILLIHDNVIGAFNNEHRHILEELQMDISFALDKMDKQKRFAEQAMQIESQSKIYNVLHQINNLFLNTNNEDEFLEKLPNLFVEYMLSDVVLVVKFDDSDNFDIIHNAARDRQYDNLIDEIQGVFKSGSTDFKVSQMPFVKAYKNKQVYLIEDFLNNISEEFDFIKTKYGLNSCIAIPIVKEKKAIGSLVLMLKERLNINLPIYKLLNIVSSEIEIMFNKFEQDKFSKMMLTALDLGFDFVVIIDSDFRIVYANNAILTNFGYTSEELIGKHHSIVSSKVHTREFVKNFYDTLKRGDVFSSMITYRAKNGDLIHSYTTIVPFKVGGKIKYYVAAGKNLTDDINLKNRIEGYIYNDQLTGLYNLSFFRESISKYIESSKDDKSIAAVIIINPINFASINQAFGFEMGNEVLKQIASRLIDFVRNYDVVAKLESDRFGILLKDLKEEQDALAVASNLLNKLKALYRAEDNAISLSFNMGLSLYPKDGKTVSGLIDKSHIALMDAKKKGENSIGFFQENLDKSAALKIRLKLDLENALKNKEFELFYQPYVDSNRRIAGAESLMRWIKDGKIIYPNEFISFLEDSYLIIDVEDILLEGLMMETKKIESIKPIRLSINFSHQTLKNTNLIERTKNKLNQIKSNSNLLNIEIVERSFIENLQDTIDLMNQLKSYGITFSIDDFGTGYSSLSYLAQLPADYLKIDISFVRRIETKQHIRDIVESIIFLAKKLNYKTIAEGVETEEQFEILKEMGCDYFQGYLFFKPMPKEAFEEVLKKDSLLD